MSNRQAQSVMASPILIGAVTTLVTVIAVFLSYNANEGLPYVPTYDISVTVPSAAGLVEGNEVRIGGKDKAYTGCYQAGASTVRLSAQGILHTSDGNWPYRIEHGDKGAATLAIDEIGVAPNGSGFRFSRIPAGSKGVREPIAPGKGFRIGQTDFAKVPCKGKGVHSS